MEFQFTPLLSSPKKVRDFASLWLREACGSYNLAAKMAKNGISDGTCPPDCEAAFAGSREVESLLIALMPVRQAL